MKSIAYILHRKLGNLRSLGKSWFILCNWKKKCCYKENWPGKTKLEIVEQYQTHISVIMFMPLLYHYLKMSQFISSVLNKNVYFALSKIILAFCRVYYATFMFLLAVIFVFIYLDIFLSGFSTEFLRNLIHNHSKFNSLALFMKQHLSDIVGLVHIWVPRDFGSRLKVA